MMTTGGGEFLSFKRMREETYFTLIFGAGAGSTSYLFTSAYACNSLKGGYKQVGKLSPQLIKYGALVTATFCTIDFTMQYFRQKKDEYNKIAMGAASAGLLAVPLPGLGLAYRAAMCYGAFFGKSVEVDS